MNPTQTHQKWTCVYCGRTVDLSVKNRPSPSRCIRHPKGPQKGDCKWVKI